MLPGHLLTDDPAAALRLTQAHQFLGRVLLLLLDGYERDHAEREHKGPMQPWIKRATICRKLLCNGVSFWWWVVTVSIGLSDGIRQVLSAGCGGRRMICRITSSQSNEQAVNPQLGLKTLPPNASGASVPILGHANCACSTSLSDESTNIGGKGYQSRLGRGLTNSNYGKCQG